MTGQTIEISTADSGRLSAYLAKAQSGASRGGIVVLQEIFGVNANMRRTVETFAALGYDAIVPDLFWRQQPGVDLEPASAEDRERATALMKGLDEDLAIEDALAAATYLRGLGRGSGKIGAVGYCLGGKLAFLAAMRPQINAAVSYYGVAIESVLDRADRLAAPILLHIGVEDALCSPQAQAAIHAALDGRAEVEIVNHPGVGHAFARYGSAAFDQQAAETANAATANFLARHLAPDK